MQVPLTLLFPLLLYVLCSPLCPVFGHVFEFNGSCICRTAEGGLMHPGYI